MSTRLSSLARTWTKKNAAWGAVAAATAVAAWHPRAKEGGDGDSGDELTCSLLVDGRGEVTSPDRSPSYNPPGGFLLQSLPPILGASQTSTRHATCHCESSAHRTPPLKNEDKEIKRANIQRSRTLRILSSKATRNRRLSDVYDVNFDSPLGEGAFGKVLMVTNKETGERVAMKRIPKKTGKQRRLPERDGGPASDTKVGWSSTHLCPA